MECQQCGLMLVSRRVFGRIEGFLLFIKYFSPFFTFRVDSFLSRPVRRRNNNTARLGYPKCVLQTVKREFMVHGRSQILRFTLYLLTLGVTLSGGSSALASCGDYLHTRFGPPSVSPAATPGLAAVDAFSKFGGTTLFAANSVQADSARSASVRLLDSAPGRSTPQQCSGPGCHRERIPLRPPPASLSSVVKTGEAVVDNSRGTSAAAAGRLQAHGPELLSGRCRPEPATPPPDNSRC